MSTLTYTNDTFAPAAPKTEGAPRKSLWQRFVDAMVEVQQRRAEKEVARFLASRGGILTDETEREIMRLFTANGTKAF
ncbi:MAG: hypothetical protein K2X43_09750 [Hyphomonadaceae bacterium]|jgi:hypothetical protein|nr:hypothetical protein [Hyphomonadaceae bacterium]